MPRCTRCVSTMMTWNTWSGGRFRTERGSGRVREAGCAEEVVARLSSLHELVPAVPELDPHVHRPLCPRVCREEGRAARVAGDDDPGGATGGHDLALSAARRS